jgi:hypothetical protein
MVTKAVSETLDTKSTMIAWGNFNVTVKASYHMTETIQG